AAEPRLVADHGRVEEHLVGRRALATLGGELHVELDRSDPSEAVRVRVAPDADPGGRVEVDHELVGLGVVTGWPESQTWRPLEDEPELGLGHREPLAGPDEERHPRPAP